MDIARLSTDLASERLRDQVGTAVMGKALDLASERSSALLKMMEGAGSAIPVADPELGRFVDVRV